MSLREAVDEGRDLDGGDVTTRKAKRCQATTVFGRVHCPCLPPTRDRSAMADISVCHPHLLALADELAQENERLRDNICPQCLPRGDTP